MKTYKFCESVVVRQQSLSLSMMDLIHLLIPLLALAGLTNAQAAAQTSSFPTATSTVSGLNAVAQSIGKKYLGSAVDNPFLENNTYVSIISDFQQFGQLSPENAMKWVSLLNLRFYWALILVVD